MATPPPRVKDPLISMTMMKKMMIKCISAKR
jgi:hypothetical protein